MIRLAWALTAEDATEPSIVTEMLAGAELAGVDWSAATAEDALQSTRKLIDADVPIVCLASRVTLPSHLGGGSAWLDPTRGWVMAAAELGATQLRLTFDHSRSTRNRPSAVRLADQLAALAELAGQQGVRILLETRGEFASPSDLWRVLELSDSANLSACLSLSELESADDSTTRQPSTGEPKVRFNTVSILNLRLRYVHIQTRPSDSFSSGATAAVHHLRGIGYDGLIGIAVKQDRLIDTTTAVRKLIQPPKAKPAPAVMRK